jgi:tol-pal system protein YbgF
VAGCASTDESALMRREVSSMQYEQGRNRNEADRQISDLRREMDGLRQQVLTLSTTVEGNDDKTKNMLGRLDELSFRMGKLQEEMKKVAQAAPAPARPGQPVVTSPPAPVQPAKAPPAPAPPVMVETKPEYETQYRLAFEAFQKAKYEDSASLFREFLETTPETRLWPNAYFWLGESYIYLKDYEKSVLAFQELADKYPKHERAPRALLSQAEAFTYMRDSKSAETVLKKIIETYPKTEEASVAERRLKSLDRSVEAPPEKPKPAEKEAIKKFVTVTAEAAGLRQTPSLSVKQEVWAVKGTTLEVTAEHTEPNGRKWLKVKTKAGKEGWISDKLVKPKED